MKITVFLPCRKGSQRIPKKNIKPFAGVENGLIEIKLKQLLKINQIDTVILSTNDEEILDYAKKLHHSKLYLHQRSENLSTSKTSTDDLIEHALKLISSGHILWTHVTSPFLNTEMYEKIIIKYANILNQGYDSLMTINKIQGFLWNEKGPMNYDRNIEKWPRTQTLNPIYEINSGVFLNSCKNYQQFNDRIGNKPYLFELDKIQGFDIDWEDDFRIAESIVYGGVGKL